MFDSQGERGRYIFTNQGASADAEDLSLLGELITDLGTRRVGTSADRLTLDPIWLFPGLEWFETDTGLTYAYSSTGWALAFNALPRLRLQRPAAGAIPGDGTWRTVGMQTFQQENGSSFFTGSSSFTVAVTGRFAVRLGANASNVAAGARRVIGIAPTATPSAAVAQSPGFGAASDSYSLGIDHSSEVTLQAGVTYGVVAACGANTTFSNFDVSVRLIAPTTIG
jgi:hypothetical protein